MQQRGAKHISLSRISAHRSCQIDPTWWLVKHAMSNTNMAKS
jgi:hypothetical protein